MTEFEKMRREEFFIGAGSVVVKGIPSDSMAVGNPCRVIRKLHKK